MHTKMDRCVVVVSSVCAMEQESGLGESGNKEQKRIDEDRGKPCYMGRGIAARLLMAIGITYFEHALDPNQ
jgi:hypothetical protein